jgi:S-layer homology domain
MRPHARIGGRILGVMLLGLFMLGGTLSAGAPGAVGRAGPVASPAPCTPVWQAVNSPNAGFYHNYLHAGVALAPDDVWVAGSYTIGGFVEQTLIEHWNGSGWSIIASPNAGTDSNSLSAIAAVAANDIWAVGAADLYSTWQPLIEHWNGSSWSIVAGPSIGTNGRLDGVAAIAADDVWAVGAYTGDTYSRTLIEHWNGSTWSVVPSPNGGPRGNVLRGVAVAGPSDVWAVGYYYDWGWWPLLLHWNGSTWDTEPSPPIERTLAGYFLGVAALAPNDVWAVGYAEYSGAEQTLIEHWNGSAWSVVPSLGPGSHDNRLVAVAVRAANDVWAVGYYGDGSNNRTLILHWDGSAWSMVPSPDPGPDTNFLTSVAVSGAQDVLATGYYRNYVWQDRTLLLRYHNPCDLSPSPTPVTCTMPFTDVDLTHPFYPYIQCMYCLSIVGGYADNTFRPGATVTRGQVAKFVANAAGYTDAFPPDYQAFSDVPRGDPFWLFIERAWAHGVISGYSDRTFRPGNPVTRSQMAKFVSNAAGYADAIPPTQQTFADVPPADPFWLYIERVHLHGVIDGYSDGTFRPGASVTRGQAAKFISNAFFPGCGPLR